MAVKKTTGKKAVKTAGKKGGAWMAIVPPASNEKPEKDTSFPITDMGASVGGLEVIKQYEDEALEYAESIINTVREPLIVLDQNLRVVSVSRSFYEVFKVKPEETMGQLIYDLGNKQWDIPKLRELLETILPQKATFDNYEVEHNFATIGRRIMLLNARQIQRVLGKERIILLAIEDITERRQVENVLAEKTAELLSVSEEKYRLLVENINDVFYILDNQGKITYVSPAVERFTKYKASDLIGKPFTPIIYPADLPDLLDSFNRLASGHLEPWEFRVQDKDGNILFVRSSSQPIYKDGQITGYTALMVDITKRKQAEEALRESEVRFRLLSDAAFEAIVVHHGGVLLSANDQFFEMFGYRPDELLGKQSIPFTIAPEAIESTMGEVSRGTLKPYESIGIRKDGTKFPIEIRVRETEYLGREVRIGAIMDITERKQAEKALQESESQYRWLSEHITDGVWLLDMNLKPTYQSPSMEKLTGFTHEELMELPFEKRVTPESLQLAAELFFELMPRIIADSDYNPSRTLELEYYCKDGTTLWTENKLSGIRDENGNPLSILNEVRDITARRLYEEKLVKSYESVKKTLNDALNMVVKIVETRDPYTSGHQQRVAELATSIGREMKLEDTRIDQLRMAAFIHDIGKMYIPSDILSKPGRLSDIEFNLIKSHSQYSYDIVNGMDFPGIVAQAVLQHHERLDGSGYPNQLKGEDTLLEAKILAVADVIEAMASHRPYRPALGVDKALEEISKNKGKLYDPDVVDTCLELFNSGQFEFKSV